jgi:hypothetical protein
MVSIAIQTDAIFQKEDGSMILEEANESKTFCFAVGNSHGQVFLRSESQRDRGSQ